MKKKRIYLDNCSFNRPFDDQTVLKNYLEAEAKMYIQKSILNNSYDLVWSYIMDFEVSFNPYSDRKNQIMKWKTIAVIDISETEKIIKMANIIKQKGLKSKDALHLACAIDAGCHFFITTDSGILNKKIDKIEILDPINFLKKMEVNK